MATVTRWNPIRDLITMREAMDQVMNEAFSRTRENRQAWLLPVDAYSTPEALVLKADVPGVKPEDLQITLEGDTLTIRGEFKKGEQSTNGNANGNSYLLQERLWGKFERTLTVNTPIDGEKVEATFENGVLTLTLPKAEAVKPKSITVKRI